MDVEGFLYEHFFIVFMLPLLGLTWASEHKLITDWHWKLGLASIVTLAVYLLVSKGDPGFTALPLTVLAAILWAVVYRERPRRPRPDGSHEAL